MVMMLLSLRGDKHDIDSESNRNHGKMPRRNQQIIVDLLKAMYNGIESTDDSKVKAGFSRTGKVQFNLPADFDAHFDDLNEEIAASF